MAKKYPKQLVVIGVHTPKFDSEKNTESIRKAVLRYEIPHPVVNDLDMKIWRNYGVRGWPTLWVIDPEGYGVASGSGEGLYDALEQVIEKLIKMHRQKKTLNEEPLRFDTAKFRERANSPLYFPGKVLADGAGNRLFIADSTHHRIVVTDLGGKKIAVAGAGQSGKEDGPFDKATFNDPQGMAVKGETLYVADRKNHLIRALDLKARTVKTVAGTGEQGQDRWKGGDALKTGINSPWDVHLQGNTLYIAMAGHHQIWALDLENARLDPYAGAGPENIRDGPLDRALFAQPSGLTSDGDTLYVADSEVSAIRAVPLGGKGNVTTVVGTGLFDFGDKDGVGDEVLLQHALGVAYHDKKLYVADTYNSKIKVIDPAKRSCTTLSGGEAEGWLTSPAFSEPGGISVANGKLYVADTNAHRIRVVDLKTKAVSTLALQGVEPPKPPPEPDRPTFPNASTVKLDQIAVPADGDLTLQVGLKLAESLHLNPDTPMTYLVETLPDAKTPWFAVNKKAEPKTSLQVTVPAAKLAGSAGLRFSLLYFECSEGKSAICRIKSQIWEVPLKFDKDAKSRSIRLEGPSGTKK